MDPTSLLIAVVLAWSFSVLAFLVLPLQQWLNSGFRQSWMRVTFRSTGLTGRWLATYKLPTEPYPRYEIVHSSQLFGDEVRGIIRDEGTKFKYKFRGRIACDELVAYYWSPDEPRDIGVFKLKIDTQTQMLVGPLTVLVSGTNTTEPGVPYEWRRYSRALDRRFKRVRAGRSAIARTGLFATTRFDRNQQIGVLGLGPEQKQGEHTIKFGGKDRIVKRPWRFLNHACEPNAQLDRRPDGIVVIATQEVLPQAELTIDYRKIGEPISRCFDCNCSKCASGGPKARIGGINSPPNSGLKADG